ncbi:M18 family aminopeptidase [Pedobacter cryotolerans]|uniref:M18 family aminopeptidase n=1 Tax=Pedobacter cryotolerans TaxID=2571270 RepID=A0A4U1C9N0_9SPHI|nr:M18 family aminopeptidase [Pedobacter cryotolerans]TKC02609.1 M18 family aminopeptidase [Pedobacter cryotolerans]
MENIIQQINQKYEGEINHIQKVGKVEISITLNRDVKTADFAQKLQDDLVKIIDELTIVKINIVDADGNLCDTFSSNQ